MDIDEQLLSQNEEAKAGEFRASKRGEATQESTSIRESVQQKRLQESKDLKETEKGSALAGSSISPILKITDEILKFAWEYLFISFGLTLILINIHVFLNKVFGPTVFRDPGEEWLPESIKKIAGKSKAAASLLRIGEGSGIAVVNLSCLFIVIFILVILSIIASILSGDISFIWSLFKEVLLAIGNLFS